MGGFYWHSCNIKSGAYKGSAGGSGRVATGPQLEKTPRGIPSYSHMPNKPSHQSQTTRRHPESQTTTEDEANAWETIWVHAILLKSPPQRSLTICTGFSVFHMAKKMLCGKHLITVFWIVYKCIYDMEQQNAFHLCIHGWFSQIWSHMKLTLA